MLRYEKGSPQGLGGGGLDRSEKELQLASKPEKTDNNEVQTMAHFNGCF